MTLLWYNTVLKSLLGKSSRINFDFMTEEKQPGTCTVLVWLAHRTRFNNTCDVTAVDLLILFTQSFKAVSVEVAELFF